MRKNKNILVLGGGGFIGGHLAKRLKSEGNYVRIVDLKTHEYFSGNELCDEFLTYDLRNPSNVEAVMRLELTDDGHPLPFKYLKQPFSKTRGFDEVYQLAADMGGAGYIFTGNHDADVMHNSALINLNVAHEAVKTNVGKVFYSSSACMYPEHNQLDPENPNCEESSAYPANPDSEYGWEKLFSERLYLSFNRNYGLNVRIARFHNIFGPQGTWMGGKEKSPAAMCRKVAEIDDAVKILDQTRPNYEIEVWGDGKQTRSFLYVDECVEAVLRLMDSDFIGPVNIGSEEMVSINELAQLAIDISGKDIKIINIEGDDFLNKYGFKCPTGVRGRNSDNKLYKEKVGWESTLTLRDGMEKTYKWIDEMVRQKKTYVKGSNSN
jgi:nucleoside-diphosphate-sugar epimerase